MRRTNSLHYFFIAFIVFAHILAFAILETYFKNWQFINEPIHSTIESLGGFAAIMMAIFLFQRKGEKYNGKIFLIALGFLSAGILSIFHGVIAPGQDFVLLFTLSNLISGFWFVMIWFPQFSLKKITSLKKWSVRVLTGGLVLFGILTFSFEKPLIIMVDGSKFTSPAIAMNIIAGVFFLIAAVRLIIDYSKFRKQDIFLLIFVALLSGLAGLLFPFSEIWDSTWWMWHLTRFIAYAVVLVSVVIDYRFMAFNLQISLNESKNIGDELKILNENLELKINERTESLKQKEAKLIKIQNLAQLGNWELDIQKNELYWSPGIFNLFEIEKSKSGNTTEVFLDVVHPDDRERVRKAYSDSLNDKNSYKMDHRLLMKDGRIKYVHQECETYWDDDGNPKLANGFIQDITVHKKAENRKQSQSKILESIVSGLPLPEILELIVKSFEEEDISSLCSILVLDEEGIHLHKGAAPSLPDFYNNAIEGLEIGNGVGSCGTAAFTKKRVIVENINTHKYWAPFLELTKKAGLESCWSEPIIGNGGKVLGTFAIYHREPKKPTNEEIKLLESVTYLTSLAISSKRADEKIRNLNINLELKVKERTKELEKLNKNLFDENIERKRAEEAAYQSEKIRSLQFNNSPIGMLLCRMDGSFVDINPACTNIIGRTVEESLKLSYWDLTPQKYEQQEGEQLKSLEETGRYGPYIKEYIHKNGHLVPVELSGLILEINNERFIWSSVQDITKRKKAENEIKTAKLEAEQANLAKSEFLSRMSHELRTPMNSILGFAQLMGMGQLNPSHKRGVEHIIKSGKHLLDLINEVLDLSRIEAGKLSLMPEPVKVSVVISETLDIVQNLASAKNVSIGFVQTKVSMYHVLADNQKLKQVLINLVNNAIKYNREGGSVTIECSEFRVSGSKLYSEPETPNSELRTLNPKPRTLNPKLRTLNSEPETLNPESGTRNPEPGTLNPEPETRIRINIKDTGKGISPEGVEKLFTPFQRIGAELSEIEGTGLGLTVAKKLVEAMHGTIGVESTVGVGSTFWVELPQTKLQTATIEKGENLGKSKTPEKENKGLVLYIEDNASNIELVEQILEIFNPEIVLVTETYGKRAVKHANDYKPDLILLDLDLPDLHGSKVFERLQADDNVKNIPVVIISADAMTKQIDKLIKQGAKDYLTKPIDVVQFLKVVEEYLGSR